MSFDKLLGAYARHLPHTWDATAEAAAQRDAIRAAWADFLAHATIACLLYTKYSDGALGQPFTLYYFLRFGLYECYDDKPHLKRLLKEELQPQLDQAEYDAFVRQARFRPPVSDAWLCKLLTTIGRLIDSDRFFAEADAWVSPRVLAELIHRRHMCVMYGQNKNPIGLLRYLYEHKQLDLGLLGSHGDEMRGFADETVAFLRHVLEERRLAVAMASHSRLGAASGLGQLALHDTLSPYLYDD